MVKNGEKMITDKIVSIGNDWDEILADEWQKPYFKELSEFLRDDSDLKRVKKDEIKEKPVVQTKQEKLDVWLL